MPRAVVLESPTRGVHYGQALLLLVEGQLPKSPVRRATALLPLIPAGREAGDEGDHRRPLHRRETQQRRARVVRGFLQVVPAIGSRYHVVTGPFAIISTCRIARSPRPGNSRPGIGPNSVHGWLRLDQDRPPS